MKTYQKLIFKAWRDNFAHKTSIALCSGEWFEAALNCCRAGDMGDEDEEGYYQRIWYTDSIGVSDVEFVRNATEDEVRDYLKRCGIQYNVFMSTGAEPILVMGDEESYVLIEYEERTPIAAVLTTI